MRIRRLDLKNIGAFYGVHGFDLTIKSPKNIILFGGKNGAGKTTLLEAFRLGLFGSMAYGYRTPSDTYLQKISSLFNYKAVESGGTNFQIKLELEQVEDYENYIDIVIRSWEISNGKVRENFSVFRNGKILNQQETEIYESRMREQFPPQLFELCLFDGEEISRIVTEGELDRYLQNASKVLFNLDLFEDLEKDLSTYNQYYAQKSILTENEKKLSDLTQEHEKLIAQLKNIEKQIQAADTEQVLKKDRLASLKKDFTTYGGLMKDQRDRLQNELIEIEKERKEISEQLRSFITNLFPIYLVRELLQEVKEQIKVEKNQELNDYVQNIFDSEKYAEFIDELKKDQLINSSNQLEFIKDQIKKKFINVFIDETNRVSYIHRASFEQHSQVYHILQLISQVKDQDYLELFQKNNELLKSAQLIRRKIEDHDQTAEFKQILSEIETLARDLEAISNQLEELNEQKREIIEEIEKNEIEIDKIRTKLSSQEKIQNTLLLTSNIFEISRKFRTMQLRKKLKQVEVETLKMINRIFRKENYVRDLKIDHDTFEVTLFGNDRNEIVKERLSAGEKELLMLSIIWAMFRVSGRRTPFIYDTLLGRLDRDHRKDLIQQFLPVSGEQIIILSTDSEITEENFQILLPHLSKCYTLEFDVEENRTAVSEDVFFDYSIERVITS